MTCRLWSQSRVVTWLAACLATVAALACRGADGPKTPEAERATFRCDPGLAIDLVAREPEVVSPSALAWDEHGELFVVENPGYPTGPGGGRPPDGKLVRLRDVDGDGKVDERFVFAGGLGFPNGLLPWNGGWLVTDAPTLWWLSDRDGDGRAEVKEAWFTGFGTNSTTQLRACYPTLGPDGWIYVARGLVGGVVTSPKWTNLPPVDLAQGDFRFRPDGTGAEAIGGNTQFGLVLDDVGRRFLVSNRNPLMHAVVSPRWWRRHPALPFTELVQDVSPSGYEAKVYPTSTDSTTAGYMPELMSAPHAGTFTAACGIHQFYGEGLSYEYLGAWFVCEPAQNLVQRQRAEPDGPTFRSRRIGDGREFLSSTDGWFRPVYAATGPEGALYLVDMYRQVIDHPEYLPAEVRGRLNFDAGKDMGRIWRVRSALDGRNGGSGRRRGTAGRNDLPTKSVPELVRELGATNLWVRQTAHRLLLGRREPEVFEALVRSFDGDLEVARKSDPTRGPWNAADPDFGPHLGMARRLVLLAEILNARERRAEPGSELGNQGTASLMLAALHPSPTVRETFWRILQTRALESRQAMPDVGSDLLFRWADDPSPAVRFHFALQCGNHSDGWPIVPALVRVARRDAGDRWIRAAVLSGLKGREHAFATALFETPLPDTPDNEALLGELAALCAASESGGAIRFLVERSLDPSNEAAAWPMAVLTRLSEGLRARGAGTLEAWLERATHRSELPRSWSGRWNETRTRALALAVDSGASVARRMAAVRFLGEMEFDASRDALDRASRADAPIEVQRAAIRILGRSERADAGALLADPIRWRHWSQAIRSAAVAALVERAALVPYLLDAIERGVIPVWVVDPARRRSLQNHARPEIREQAKRVLADVGGSDRRQAFEESKSVLGLTASAGHGRDVFMKACANCHRFGPDGVSVGPDLSGVRNQPPEALLFHIVVPDAEIYPGFQAWEVETKDGRSLTGLLVSETPDAIVLRLAGGTDETLARRGIETLAASGVSLMPRELERTLSRQELADLIAFLRPP